MRELIRALLKTGGGTIVNLATGALLMKIIAIMTGPSGVGVWSILKQVQQLTQLLGTANGQVSLTRGVSALKDERRVQFVQTVAVIYTALGSFVLAGLVLFAPHISQWVKNVPSELIALVAIPAGIGIVRSYLWSLLNGEHAIGHLIVTQIAGAVCGVLVAYPFALMVREGHPVGFILLAGVSALAAVGFSVAFLRRVDVTSARNIALRWHNGSAAYFFQTAGALMVTGLVGVSSLSFVRSIVVRHGGLAEAGLFDASWSLSVIYVSMLLNSFGTYYLPKLSSLGRDGQIELIRRVGKMAVMGSIPMITIVVCLKGEILSLLYADSFLPALEMFRWTLIGDYFRISAWVLSMVTLANGYTVAMVFGSILWDLGLAVGAYFAIRAGLGIGAIGVVIMALHIASLVFYYAYIRGALEFSFPGRLVVIWVLGFVLVMAVSVAQWDHGRVNLAILLLGALAAGALSWMSMDAAERKHARNLLLRARSGRS